MRVLSKTLAVLALCAGFFALGSSYGSARVSGSTTESQTRSEVLAQADFQPFFDAWQLLEQKHIKGDSIKPQDRVWGAIQGLAQSYDDPYTEFFPPVQSKQFDEELSGSFGGIGIDLGIKDQVLTVIAPLKDTPAYKAGVQKGDKILKIDNTSTADLTIDGAINLIRGEKGTPVVLTIYRESEGAPREVKLVRATIDIPTLETDFDKKNNVFVISLFQFSSNAPELFANALTEFKNSGTKKLVLDLRGNPGGYLDVAVDLASWFVPTGKKIVIEDYGVGKDQIVYRSEGHDSPIDVTKMVVLVDGGSASASEILAGALDENDAAVLVGEKTFGKGVVQEPIDLTETTKLKITVAKWLTPKGNSINDHGLTPEYVVPFTKDDADKNRDLQMAKAIEILNKK